jgi:hypothetical protein
LARDNIAIKKTVKTSRGKESIYMYDTNADKEFDNRFTKFDIPTQQNYLNDLDILRVEYKKLLKQQGKNDDVLVTNLYSESLSKQITEAMMNIDHIE